MGRTVIQLIVLAAKQTALDVIDDTADASGGGTTTLLDAALKKYPDNYFIARHLYIDGGSPTIRSNIITDFTQSTGTVTFRVALGAAPDSLDYLILPFARDDILDAITDAILELHDQGDLVREFELSGIVGGSPLYNAGFDYWDSATVVNGWARNGTGTIARERNTQFIWSSPQSLKLSTAADYVKLGEPWKRFLEDLKGGTMRFLCPVKTSTASIARINLYADASNYSSLHSGDGGWEVLDTGDISVAETVNDIEPRLYNDGTAAVYFADPWIVTSKRSVRDYPYPIQLSSRIAAVYETQGTQRPTSNSIGAARHLGRHRELHEWSLRSYSDEAASTEGGLLSFHGERIPQGERRLIIKASGPLTVPSADADVIEVDQTEAYLIANLAAAMLLEKALVGRPVDVQNDYRRQATNLRRQNQQLSAGHGQRAQVTSLPRAW